MMRCKRAFTLSRAATTFTMWDLASRFNGCSIENGAAEEPHEKLLNTLEAGRMASRFVVLFDKLRLRMQAFVYR